MEQESLVTLLGDYILKHLVVTLLENLLFDRTDEAINQGLKLSSAQLFLEERDGIRHLNLLHAELMHLLLFLFQDRGPLNAVLAK